jgi:hypothetical protein
MANYRSSMLITLVLSAIVSAFASGGAEGAQSLQINGVWSCQVTRPGSTVLRPLTFVFHSDGTFSYSSQTTINGGPLSLPFTGRGGANGQWQKVGTSDYAYQSIENMYINGNAGGLFYVDAVLHLDTKTGQLCSGRPECPLVQTKIQLTQFTFAPDGSITGEDPLLPAGSLALVTCAPQSALFTGLP